MMKNKPWVYFKTRIYWHRQRKCWWFDAAINHERADEFNIAAIAFCKRLNGD